MPHFIEIPKDIKVVEAYQFDGTLESAKTIVHWFKSIGKYGRLEYSNSGCSGLYVNNFAATQIKVQPSTYIIVHDNIHIQVLPQDEFESKYQPQPLTEEESDNNFNKLMKAIDNTTPEQLIALGIIEPDPRLTDLLDQVEKLLDGINCREDEEGPYGSSGWWLTEDGAMVGRIKLRELEELIQSHWSNNTTQQKPQS
jgi:hypothetical protein